MMHLLRVTARSVVQFLLSQPLTSTAVPHDVQLSKFCTCTVCTCQCDNLCVDSHCLKLRTHEHISVTSPIRSRRERSERLQGPIRLATMFLESVIRDPYFEVRETMTQTQMHERRRRQFQCSPHSRVQSENSHDSAFVRRRVTENAMDDHGSVKLVKETRFRRTIGDQPW